MRILITNDDGIYSPGLAALAKVAARFGDVRIVAPDVEMSSAGHSITSPARFGISERRLIPSKLPREWHTSRLRCPGNAQLGGPDIVLSGINFGSNLGNAMWHSGTLAGAKQAVLLGLRGIAFSAPTLRGDPDFSALESTVALALDVLLPARELSLVNVNFPEGASARATLDAAIGAALRRPRRARQGPDGTGAFLVRRQIDRTAGRGHRPLGGGAGLPSMTPLRLDLHE